MIGIKTFTLYVIVQATLLILFAYYLDAHAALKIDYPYSEYEPGEYIDEYTQFFTYESICSGYYLVDYSNKNKIKYTGYGDLAEKYTYTLDANIVASSTTSN